MELRAPGVLQLFFGADPAALAPLQAEAYRRELAELEAITEGDDGTGPRGPWLALEAGIRASTAAVEFWEDLERRHPRRPRSGRFRGMATAAEPLPAQLPLPGGRPGATVRVHPLLTAHGHRAAGRRPPRRGPAGGLEGARPDPVRRPTA